MPAQVCVYLTHVQPTRAVQDRHRTLRQIIDLIKAPVVVADVAADEEAKARWLSCVGGRAAPASARELPCIVGLDGTPFHIEQLIEAHDEGRLQELLGLAGAPALAPAFNPVARDPPRQSLDATPVKPRESYRPSIDLDGVSITSSQADQVLDDLFAAVERMPELAPAPTFQTTPVSKPPLSTVTQLATPPMTPSPTTLFARTPVRAPSPPATAMETLPTPPMTPDLSTTSPSIAASGTLTPHTSLSPTVRSSVGGIGTEGKDDRSLSQQYAFLSFEPEAPTAVDLRSFLAASPATPGAIAAARRESTFSAQQDDLTGLALSPDGQSLEDLGGLMAAQPPTAPLFASRAKALPSPVTPVEAPQRPASVASKRSAPRIRQPAEPVKPSRGLFSCCSSASYYDHED